MSGIEAVAHALAGSSGGIVAMTLLYPLENIRTRLQVQQKPTANRGDASAADATSEQQIQTTQPKHTCNKDEQTPSSTSACPTEECISPETPCTTSSSSSAPTDSSSSLNATANTAAATKSATPFALHAPRLEPLAPPCLACILEHSSSVSSSSSSSSSTVVFQDPTKPLEYQFNGSLDVIRQVCAREGWTKLYSGLESALIGVGASSAVYFFWYYTFKSIVLASSRHPRTSMGPIENLGVASVAGIVNVFMTLPIWLVNTRMAVAAPGEYTSVYDACMKIYEENGLSGFYRGLMPSLILVSNPAIQFVVYEQMIRIWTKAAARAAQRAIVAGAATAAATSTTPIRLSSLQYFFLGAFAKAVATLATYPYQVVKSRLQASRTSSSQSTWSLVLSMWRNEGIGSFYAGMNAKMSQTVLNSAFMFAVYERLVRIILKFLTWMRSEYAKAP